MNAYKPVKSNAPCILLMLAPLKAAAADTAVAAPSFSQAFQVVLALLLVLGLIALLATFFRRMNFIQGQGRNVISVLATMAVGNKERLLLIQVGDDQILVSQGHGDIRKIHTLTRHVDVQDTDRLAQGGGFQRILDNLLERRG